MRSNARKLAAVAAVVAIAPTAAGAALSLPRRDGAAWSGGPALGITGGASGLYPGGAAVLRLTIHNRRPIAVIVRALDVRVGAARRACPGSVVRPERYRGRFAIGAKRRRTLRLSISMSASASNACRGARFPLRFRAVAVNRR